MLCVSGEFSMRAEEMGGVAYSLLAYRLGLGLLFRGRRTRRAARHRAMRAFVLVWAPFCGRCPSSGCLMLRRAGRRH